MYEQGLVNVDRDKIVKPAPSTWDEGWIGDGGFCRDALDGLDISLPVILRQVTPVSTHEN